MNDAMKAHRVRTDNLEEKFKNKAYRDSYMAEHVRSDIASQIRLFRIGRGWTQTQLAERAGTSAGSISRLENTKYGRRRLSVAILLAVASAFDFGLIVNFIGMDDFIADIKRDAPRP